MAEAIVAAAVQTIADLTIGEARFLSDVRGQLELLQTDLRQMQSFLKDAENKQEGSERVRNWVAEIRDIAYDAEDITQTFVLKVASRPWGRFISMITWVPYRYEIGSEISSLRDKLEVISRGMQTLGIIKLSGEGEANHSENETRQLMRRSYPHDEEDDVITLKKCTRELMAQLLADDEDRVCVVSIVGMGGLGNTTLAKKVYNNIEVRRHFDCLCWAFISQQFSVRDVLLEILKQISASREERDNWEKMKPEELIMTLYKILQSKLYLVVLDDIWSNEAWSSLKQAFPKGKKGSKVLFTTRIIDVALHADPKSSPLEPPFLTTEESWSLFCKKAFLKQVAPLEMEKLGKEMVKKCGGLPLAIVVLGGLLAAKKSQKEWELVLKSINSQFANSELQQRYAGVYGILALSYQALPWYLKPCFLYLSQFPEDWEIHKTMLVRMWMAEGFISQSSTHRGDETMEDVGEQYLQELISRCMIQVNRIDHEGIGVKTFRMHDLMRDMCQSKAREENFLAVSENQIFIFEFVGSAISQRARRVAVHSKKIIGSYCDAPKPEGNNTARIRSLLFFVDQESYDKIGRRQHGFLFRNFRLLRVLNLMNVHVKDGRLTSEVGNLIYLKFLRLTRCEIKQFPASIGNLQSLYTLDLRYNGMEKLPNVLWKLCNLRHLLLYLDSPRRLETLQHLETMKMVDAKALIRKMTLDKLINLRCLGILFGSTKEVNKVLNSVIFQYGRLRSLNMEQKYKSDVSYQNLEPLSHCRNLMKLKLWGKIEEDFLHNPPHQHNLDFIPSSLSKLCLRESWLKQDPMPILEKLENLRVLALEYRSYEGLIMVCSANGFPHLEHLKLSCLYELKEWRVEKGAMPNLMALNIDNLRNLSKIPRGLKYVTTLQKLSLFSQPEAFGKRIQVINGVEGEDFYKVKHVPSISVRFPGTS